MHNQTKLNKMRKFTNRIIAMLFFLVPLFASAQTAVSGKVVNQKDGSPLSGVSVVIVKKGSGTKTDGNGQFTINGVKGDLLEFSIVGFNTQKLLIRSDAAVLTVKMVSSSIQLSDVVVTVAQGIQRNNRSLSYSAPKVTNEELTQTNRENFLSAIQGRVAGATVTSSTGMPGASTSIILRGPVSFDGNNQPLIVVDGLPISNKTLSQGQLVSDRPNRDNDYSNRAIDLNPDDIEELTVLSGSEATALYGTDGASGVILIKTKKAKAGTGKVTYSNNFSFTAKPELLEIQNIYDQGSNGIVDNGSRSYFGPKYEPSAKLYNNINSFFKGAVSQKHDLSFEGGTDKISFRLSPSYSNYAGPVPNTKLERTSVRLSASSHISNKLQVDGAFSFINTFNEKGSRGQQGYYLSLLSWPQDDDATNYIDPLTGKRRIITSGSTELDNPFWDVTKNKNLDKTNRLLGSFSATLSPYKWLSFTGRLGADFYATRGNRLWHPQSGQGFNAKGVIENYVDNTQLINGSFVANIKVENKVLTHNLSIGANFDKTKSDIESYRGERFYLEDYNSINNTDPTSKSILYAISDVRKYGIFGNYNLGFKRTLYLSATGRLDNSSNLVPNDASFFYSGAGLSFVFSELLRKQLPVLSFGKLKLNVATTGKDPRLPYLTRDRLDPQVTTGGGFGVNVTLGNKDLKAEFTTTKEAGVELKFFKNRLSIDATYYYIKTKDQITAPRLSYGTGGILAYINSGEVENRGWQISASGIPVQSKDFTWNISAVFAQNKGKIISTPANQKSFYISDTWLYAGVRGEFSLGNSISSLASNYYLRNNNGQVLINPANGLPVRSGAGEFKVVGDRAPDFSIGLTNRFSYKNFSFSLLFDIRKGGDVFNGNELYLTTIGLSKKTLDREVPRVLEGVLQDGKENTGNPTKNNIVVIPYYNNGYYNSQYTEEEFIEKDINWLRLQDLSMAYNVPASIFQNAKIIKGLQFNVSAQNLFIITNYRGIDPSVSGLSASVGGFGGSGIDYGVLPSPKIISVGISAKF
jgi:ferric enterobactin receptor